MLLKLSITIVIETATTAVYTTKNRNLAHSAMSSSFLRFEHVTLGCRFLVPPGLEHACRGRKCKRDRVYMPTGLAAGSCYDCSPVFAEQKFFMLIAIVLVRIIISTNRLLKLFPRRRELGSAFAGFVVVF